MPSKCPKCRSNHVEHEYYEGLSCLVCLDCGYDERDEYDVVPEGKPSQKAKGSYTPYKAGGGRRVQK